MNVFDIAILIAHDATPYTGGPRMKKPPRPRRICWEIPSERIVMLHYLRAVDPGGWRDRWARLVRAAGWARWIVVTGWLISQSTTASQITGQLVTTCVYETPYGTVQVVVRGSFCAATRRLDVE